VQAVDSKKIVKYHVDGYDIVTNALKDLLNQYPGLETGEVFKFSTLKEEKRILLEAAVSYLFNVTDDNGVYLLYRGI
jgi:hypothetical protein